MPGIAVTVAGIGRDVHDIWPGSLQEPQLLFAEVIGDVKIMVLIEAFGLDDEVATVAIGISGPMAEICSAHPE